MASSHVLYPSPGCIVEFMQGNKPLIAWVLEEKSGNLRLYTINKRELSLASSRLLPWSGPACSAGCSRQEIDEKLRLHRKRRDEYTASVNLDDLWELAQGELGQADIKWFAELVWSSPDIDQLAGLGQAMLAQRNYFKFSPPYFIPYTEEQVKDRIEKEDQENRLNTLLNFGTDFFKKLYEADRKRSRIGSDDLPPPEVAEALKAILLSRIADPDSHENKDFWRLLTKGLSAKNLSDDPHLPMLLAVAWGLVPEHYNFWLDRVDYGRTDAWSQEFANISDKIAADLAAAEPAEAGSNVSDKVFISIDPASTRDRDDAFSLHKVGENYRLSLAFSNPSLFWPFGSALDKAVLRRTTSLYLPEASHYMIPESCVELFGLKAGILRPVILLDIDLDAEGNVIGLQPSNSWIKVEENFVLEECEAIFMEGHAPNNEAVIKQEASLCAAYALALKLQQKRIESGAVVTERVEPEILLQEDKNGLAIVKMSPGIDFPCSQLIVGEFMILANSVLASWCNERGLPVFYRTQDVALPREFAGVWSAPEDIARVLRAFAPTHLETVPKPHAGLGLKMYASFSAPMRRYPDLLNIYQLSSFLSQGKTGFTQKELEEMLPLLSARQDVVGQIQRYRPRYWKLVYFQQQEQLKTGLKYWEAIVTDENNNFVTVMLEWAQLALRGPRSLFGERTIPGSRVQIRLGKINPLRNEIQIMEVLEG